MQLAVLHTKICLQMLWLRMTLSNVHCLCLVPNGQSLVKPWKTNSGSAIIMMLVTEAALVIFTHSCLLLSIHSPPLNAHFLAFSCNKRMPLPTSDDMLFCIEWYLLVVCVSFLFIQVHSRQHQCYFGNHHTIIFMMLMLTNSVSAHGEILQSEILKSDQHQVSRSIKVCLNCLTWCGYRQNQ